MFEIERGINEKSANGRRTVRQELSRSLVADLEAWMREERPKLSRSSDVEKAIYVGSVQHLVFPRRHFQLFRKYPIRPASDLN